MRRILVIGPNDSADRITRVAHALAARRPGLVPMTPVEILAGQESWPDAYQRALKGSAAVVCVPRPDSTIGSGTLHDLVQAHAANVPVRVVGPSGRLRTLEEAGLEVNPKPRHGDMKVWRTRAASFTWRGKALPKMFGGPGVNSA